MHKSKSFTHFKEAMAYSNECKALGFRSYVKEFYGWSGKYYAVLVWDPIEES